jgi:hypothetical protein
VAHVGGLNFSCVQHEQYLGAGFSLNTAASNYRAARFRHGHHHLGMDVRSVLVVNEICVQQAEPWYTRITPVPGRVSTLRIRHTAAILVNTPRHVPAMIAALAMEAAMIVRIWRGWAANSATADLYEEFLRSTFLPSIHSIKGYHGASVLRRTIAGGGGEFTTLTRFESLESIRAFAGR